MAVYKVQAPDGKIIKIEGPDGASQDEIMSQAQKLYQPQQAPEPSLGDKIGRQIGLTSRAIGEGIVDLAAPFADPLAGIANKGLEAVGSSYRFPEQSQAFSNALTKAGVPAPQGDIEKLSNFGGRLLTGIAASSPINKAIVSTLKTAPERFIAPTAKTEAAKVMEKNQIPLDKAQSSGNPILQRLRSALTDNPVTTGKQQEFAQGQQKAFNKAVLRSIGSDADEATQKVMSGAKQRIGQLFDKVGKHGAVYDNQLENDISGIMDEASRTVLDTGVNTLKRNVDDILNAVDDNGLINGSKFIQIRSNLSALSKKPDVGPIARQLHDALIGALQRSNPKDAQTLSKATDQWRSMRVIESAIGKGMDKDISPLRLSNALFSKAQRTASVYGTGGNQDLINLSQAARSTLPEALPNSGTIPRGLMQAPLRSIATGVPMKLLQRYLLSQPSQAGTGIMALPTGAIANRALVSALQQQNQ